MQDFSLKYGQECRRGSRAEYMFGNRSNEVKVQGDTETSEQGRHLVEKQHFERWLIE